MGLAERGSFVSATHTQTHTHTTNGTLGLLPLWYAISPHFELFAL
uniref:Uncharacterized protein n=1 Tax=Anguilla anguilla TaxID=7936 RepID=A0A0E9VEJ5_ANGAN